MSHTYSLPDFHNIPGLEDLPPQLYFGKSFQLWFGVRFLQKNTKANVWNGDEWIARADLFSPKGDLIRSRLIRFRDISAGPPDDGDYNIPNNMNVLNPEDGSYIQYQTRVFGYALKVFPNSPEVDIFFGGSATLVVDGAQQFSQVFVPTKFNEAQTETKVFEFG